MLAPGQPWPEPPADLTAPQVLHSSTSLAGGTIPPSRRHYRPFPVRASEWVCTPEENFREHHRPVLLWLRLSLTPQDGRGGPPGALRPDCKPVPHIQFLAPNS